MSGKMVTVKVLEKFAMDNQAYLAGEVRAVPEDVAKVACEHGWAEDTSGGIPTGERSIHPRTLQVQKMVHRNKASNAGPKE